MILENIKHLCEQQGINISRLERELGFGNATIRGWENSSPSVVKLKKVADYFGVTIESLITNEGSAAV
ncbi:MAG: helix-turn-helix transcriptional regulator [Clostridia bacterium]|nr:helix-turn-helix transcriptional regulator [Clostridia bacterium]